MRVPLRVGRTAEPEGGRTAVSFPKRSVAILNEIGISKLSVMMVYQVLTQISSWRLGIWKSSIGDFRCTLCFGWHRLSQNQHSSFKGQFNNRSLESIESLKLIRRSPKNGQVLLTKLHLIWRN